MAKPMLAYNPVMQFFNTDGTVLNGGKIYIYQPGTTTLLNTYPTAADAAAGTNANPNPMICDSSGRPSSGGNPYECYVTQSYKMVVKTSADVTVRTVDNVVTLGQLVATSAKSTNYTVTTSDRDKIIVVDSSGGNKTITLPAAATAGDGFIVRVKKMDTSSNLVLIQGNAAENIDGANYTALTQSYEYVTLTCDGTQWIKDRPKGQLFWVEVTCGQAALASGGSVTIQASAGSQQFKVRNIILSGSGTNFSGGGGNRLLSVTDNTSTWTVVPAATLQSLAASKWGDSTPVPFPATAAHINTASAAGTAIVAKYSGGTTDYTAGSCTLLVQLERVT